MVSTVGDGQLVAGLKWRGTTVVLCLGWWETTIARVAELADALASGASARKGVGVQVPPRAHIFISFFLGKSSWLC